MKKRFFVVLSTPLFFWSDLAWSLSADQEAVIQSNLSVGSTVYSAGDVGLLIGLFIGAGYLLWTSWVSFSSYSAWSQQNIRIGDMFLNIVFAIAIMMVVFWLVF